MKMSSFFNAIWSLMVVSLVALIALTVWSISRLHDYTRDCSAMGGVVVQGQNGTVCIKRDSVLNMEGVAR